jgi:hypothetical protein
MKKASHTLEWLAFFVTRDGSVQRPPCVNYFFPVNSSASSRAPGMFD